MEFTLWDVARNLLLAARWTLALSALAFTGGMIAGFLIMLARISPRKPVWRAAEAYIGLFQGTPLLMQLFLVFFGLPKLGLRIDPWSAATIALTLSASAYLAEIWRAGVQALPPGQWDAGASLGLHYFNRLRLVILPQAMRIVRAPTVGYLVQLIKSTALASIIGFQDVMLTAKNIANAPFMPFTPFTVYGLAALIFFAICFPLTRYAKALERRQVRLR